MEKTTITLKPQTRERLSKFGRFGESFDEVVNRVLNQTKMVPSE